MAELLIGLVQLTAGSLKARPLGGGEHELAAEPLPPPIIPGNYDKRAASCMMNVRRPCCRCGCVAGARGWSAPGLDAASCGSCGRHCAPSPLCLPPPPCPAPPQRAFERVVVEKRGFKWVNERPDAKSENDEKWGWIGTKPGDFVVLQVGVRVGRWCGRGRLLTRLVLKRAGQQPAWRGRLSRSACIKLSM